MKTSARRTAILGAALCAVLVTGCTKAETKSTASTTPATKSAAPAGGSVNAAAADMVAKASDAAKKSSDAMATAASDADAALDQIPTQEAVDAAAAKEITSANADAEYEKLVKEMEKGDG